MSDDDKSKDEDKSKDDDEKKDDKSKDDKDEKPKKRNYVPLVILLIVIGIASAVGYHYYQNSKTYESTDDAQVEGDVVSISSELSARIIRLYVDDNQPVKKGQILVDLDPSDFQVRLAQAKSALEALKKREQAAQSQLRLTQQTGTAGVEQGEAGVEAARANVETMRAGIGQAEQTLVQAQAGVEASRASLLRYNTEVDSARSEVRRLDLDVQRYELLYAQEEISKQQLDATKTSARQAHDRLVAAVRQVQNARAMIAQSQAVVGQARETIAQRVAQVRESESHVTEAQSRLKTAQTAPQQVAVQASQVKVAQADLTQAQANIELAAQDVGRTRILAPTDGVVSRRTAQEGAYVQKGSPLLALVKSQNVWVVANFKETQMTYVKPGLNVDVEVDTYPGKTFHGEVQTIQAGTGARFSLLPPENAAGSYVKVVQRIPVKITFKDATQFKDTPLRPGMSVIATVRLNMDDVKRGVKDPTGSSSPVRHVTPAPAVPSPDWSVSPSSTPTWSVSPAPGAAK